MSLSLHVTDVREKSNSKALKHLSKAIYLQAGVKLLKSNQFPPESCSESSPFKGSIPVTIEVSHLRSQFLFQVKAQRKLFGFVSVCQWQG